MCANQQFPADLFLFIKDILDTLMTALRLVFYFIKALCHLVLPGFAKSEFSLRKVITSFLGGILKENFTNKNRS